MDRDEFAEHVSKALARLYDYAFLQTSPLARVLVVGPGDAFSSRSRGQALRRLLLDAVERLRPPEGTPAGHQAWRPYRIVEARYVAGLDLTQTCEELGLSKSQLYREQARALDALGSMLWNQRPQPKEGAGGDADPLWSEVAELSRQERPETVDVRTILTDLCELLAPAIARHSCSIETSLPEYPLWVYAVPTVLRQVLMSAMSLTLGDACSGSSARVRAFRERDKIVIEVRHGARSAGESQSSILAFASAIGGSVESETGVVRISLPSLERDQALLLIDNSAELAQLFARYLTGTPWSLVYAPTVEEALLACKRRVPNAIVLDVLMPGQDGWHFLARLRKSDVLRDVPVAICSVLDAPELALSLGANEYLRKPVTQDALSSFLADVDSGRFVR